MTAEQSEVESCDEVNAIMAYEQGDLDEKGTIELFRRLVDSGLAFRIQGHYGRTARVLIKAGYIRRPT